MATRRKVRQRDRVTSITLNDLDPPTLARIHELLRHDTRSIHWKTERDRYLGAIPVVRTQDNYRRCLRRLEDWCDKLGVNPIRLTRAQADDWIADECTAGWAAATVNLDVTAASAFWTWLERRHEDVQNPFRGTRQRPKRVPARPLVVPSPQEIDLIILAASLLPHPETRAVIVTLARTGLRRGALPGLRVEDGLYSTISKGRAIKGRWPEEAAAAVRIAHLSAHRPFAALTAQNISERIRHLCERLFRTGQLRAAYSAHDLRHAFAIAHYKEHRDIYATSRALHHASVGMTAVYLRSLPGIDIDDGGKGGAK